MNGDLISRSALLEQECFMDDDNGFRCSVVLSIDVRRAPAVDAEQVFEQMGLVKEAFEMAKADLVAVVRCKDCKHLGDDIRCPMRFEEEYGIDEGDGYFDTGYITHDRTVDDGFCDRGERRADDAD